MSNNLPTKGKQGFRRNHVNGVIPYLMNKNKISNYAVSLAFGITEQTVIKYINNPYHLTLRQLFIFSAILNTRVEVLVALLYRNHRTIDSSLANDIDSELLSLSSSIKP